MLKLLSKESLTINALAENFDMTRPAAQHIKIFTRPVLLRLKTLAGKDIVC
jgi:hypothetical protein